jgi:transposase
MPKNDLSRSFTALDQDSTLIVVIEMSLNKWLAAALVPGVERHPLKKLDPDASGLLAALESWRTEAARNGRKVDRVCIAYEAGRDGFWLARLLRARGIEAYVIHPTSIPVKRDHRRAKTDRLDCALLMRSFLGWLRGEAEQCQMVAIPSREEEDARRPQRERDALTAERTRIVNRIKSGLIRLGIRDFNPKGRKAADRLDELQTAEGVPLPTHTLAELKRQLERYRFIAQQLKAIRASQQRRLEGSDHDVAAMMRAVIRVIGLGTDTAELLATEVFVRALRDERAVARYGGLTGAPDESGSRRREKGLARAGNARVRKAMIQLAWRFLRFQEASALAKWYRERTEGQGAKLRKTMIVALARKLLIMLWRLATTGQVPADLALAKAA